MTDDRRLPPDAPGAKDRARPLSIEDILLNRPRGPRVVPDLRALRTPSADATPPSRDTAGVPAAEAPAAAADTATAAEQDAAAAAAAAPAPSTPEVLARRLARRWALQLLYAMTVNPVPVEDAESRLMAIDRADLEEADDLVPPTLDGRQFARELADAAARDAARHDAAIAARLKNWRIERLTMVDRLILHLGLAELARPKSSPVRVVLNECIELAKEFGTGKSPAFVNGVLDALARELRPGEVRERRKRAPAPPEE